MENETEKVRLGIGERMKAISPDFTTSTNKMVEGYLAHNLPELIQKHDLALMGELNDIDAQTVSIENRVEDLEIWKGEATMRIDDGKRRVELLEKKHGVKG
ncbi:MAG: hypothetical protein QCI82_07860 [Candidatus Thermoplasmatota archaeon]|nr:hypothetical protein [Candidatus Thermoplasmatota archaeon]